MSEFSDQTIKRSAAAAQEPAAGARSRASSRMLMLCALCPLLAVSDTVVNAIGLGVAALIIAPTSALLYAVARRWLTPETQLAGALMTFAGVTACMELILRAYLIELHDALGVFLPLIAANIVLLGDVTASGVSSAMRVRSAASTSAKIALALLALGVARELVGRGSLLHDAGLMFGPWARALEMHVFRVDMGFLLGMLPPGAFIALGLLLAARNVLSGDAPKRDGGRS